MATAFPSCLDFFGQKIDSFTSKHGDVETSVFQVDQKRSREKDAASHFLELILIDIRPKTECRHKDLAKSTPSFSPLEQAWIQPVVTTMECSERKDIQNVSPASSFHLCFSGKNDSSYSYVRYLFHLISAHAKSSTFTKA